MGKTPDPPQGTESAPRSPDTRVATHRRRSRVRLRDWGMRTKLAAVLVIPSIAFLVVASVQVSNLADQTSALNRFEQQVAVGRHIIESVDQLQLERDRVAGELAGLHKAGGYANRDAAVAVLKPLFTATNEAIEQLEQAARPLADSDAAWRVSYSEAMQRYQQVIYIRGAVVPAVLSSDTVLGHYHRAIDSLMGLLAEPSPGPDHPELTEAVLRYVHLGRVKETTSHIRAELYSAARAGKYNPETPTRLNDLRSQNLAAVAAFRVSATKTQKLLYDKAAQEADFVAAGRMEATAIPLSNRPAGVPAAEQWWGVSQKRQDLLRRVESSVFDDALAQAEAASTGQLRRTVLGAAGVLAVLLTALMTSLLIGRSIAQSLGLLRGQAMRIAHVELPDALARLQRLDVDVSTIHVAPPVIKSLDEVGELAQAFVAVHRSAVKVAVEQALMRRTVNAMFVNLARRSQVLVERQLDLLDQLENEESDPDQLENLFRLDHLAARMRRNDESLLVLAGSESTRRWKNPVSLSAVLLAGSAEIEQYPRVRQGKIDPLHIVGHAVGDLVHLFAELLENATNFSRPDTTVQVTGRAEGNDAVVTIVDEGIGMSASALAEANATLATPPAADIAASERMGHFVVSHLAARHGIQAQLRAEGHGLVAEVRLPAYLIAPAPEQPLAPKPVAARPVSASVSPGPWDMPVAGRPPQHTNVRQVAVRAEDVLPPASGAPSTTTGSTWWSRQPALPAAPAAAPHVAQPSVVPAQGVAPSSVVAGQAVARPTAAPVRVEEVSRPRPAAGDSQATHRGLPVRVPMAHLPQATVPAQPARQTMTRDDPDPDAVGGMLSRLYGGVRRAEAEETTQIIMPVVGLPEEGSQR